MGSTVGHEKAERGRTPRPGGCRTFVCEVCVIVFSSPELHTPFNTPETKNKAVGRPNKAPFATMRPSTARALPLREALQEQFGLVQDCPSSTSILPSAECFQKLKVPEKAVQAQQA